MFLYDKFKIIKTDFIGNSEIDLLDFHSNEFPFFLYELFQPTQTTKLLSRNYLYYTPKQMADYFLKYSNELLIFITSNINNKKFYPILLSVLENIENILLAISYNLTNDAITNLIRDSLISKKINLLENMILELIILQIKILKNETLDNLDFSNWSRVLDIVKEYSNTEFRLFRECDNRIKIMNECEIILFHIYKDKKFETILCPLYGATRLGYYLKAFILLNNLSLISVIFIKIGFHDQEGINYWNEDDSINFEKIIPLNELEKFRISCYKKDVLIVDDNIGYGKTIEAIKSIIQSLKGRSFSRCVEVSWHLLDNDMPSEIPNLLNYPTIRETLYHKIQLHYINILLRKDFIALNKFILTVTKDTLQDSLSDYAISEEIWNKRDFFWLLKEIEILKKMNKEILCINPKEYNLKCIQL